MSAMGRCGHVAAAELLRRDRDSQAGQTSIWELQAIGDVLDGGAPIENGGVCKRGVVLSQGQLAIGSEHESGGFKAMVSGSPSG
jgi:hypothetical protein